MTGKEQEKIRSLTQGAREVSGAQHEPWRKPVLARLSLAETKQGVISSPVENPFGFGILGTNV